MTWSTKPCPPYGVMDANALASAEEKRPLVRRRLGARVEDLVFFLEVSQRQVDVLYLTLVFLVQVDSDDGGMCDTFDVLLELLELDVKQIHEVLCVLPDALGCTVQKVELESCVNLVFTCVLLQAPRRCSRLATTTSTPDCDS